MPRLRALRIGSVALLLLGASFEPAWTIWHAVAHFGATSHDAEGDRHGPFTGDPAVPLVSGHPENDGHLHPVFLAPVRPSSDLVLALEALPSAILQADIQGEGLEVRTSLFASVSARASPGTSRTAQPRAPPIA